MTYCKFKVGGSLLTEQELTDKVKLLSGPGGLRLANLNQDMVSQEEALKIVKAWLPNAVIGGGGTWVKFIPTLIKSQMENIHLNLMGKIADGAIQLETTEEGLVSKRILTHEILHLVQQYGMSPKWKERFRNALKEEFGVTELNELNEDQLEHLGSRLFETLETPKTKLQRFLDMISSLIRFFISNKNKVTKLGALIQSGFFSRAVKGIDTDYKANYSVIKKYFHKNINAYEAAKAWLMKEFDSIMDNPNNLLPITREEAIFAIQPRLLKQQAAILEAKNEAEEKRDETLRQIELKKLESKKVPSHLLDKHAGAKILYDRYADILTGLQVLTYKINTEDNQLIIQMIKDIFPNWSLSNSLVMNISDAFVGSTGEQEEELGEIVHTDGLRNETSIREREDEALKTSTAIKDFLSFIRVKETTEDGNEVSQDEYDLSNYIPYQWAFAKLSELFTNYIDLDNITLDQFLQTINEIKSTETVSTWTNTLLESFKNLFFTAYKAPHNAPNTVTIRMYQEAITNDIKYGVFVSTNGENMWKQESSYLFNNASNKNANFTSLVISASEANKGVPIMETLFAFASEKVSVTAQNFKDIYEYHKAIDTLNEMHNHFGSLDKREYYIAIGEYKKGKYAVSYSSESDVDNTADIRSQIQNAFISALSNRKLSNSLKVKFTNKKEVKEFFTTYLGLSNLVSDLSLSNPDIKELEGGINDLMSNIPSRLDVKNEESLSEWSADNKGRLTKIANVLAKDSKGLEAQSVYDSTGNRIHKLTTSSFGIKLIKLLHSVKSVVRAEESQNYSGGTWDLGWKSYLLPEFIWTPLFQNNSIVKGIQKIHSKVILHDAVKSPFLGKSWTFTRETKRLWWARNFVYGFLSQVSSKDSKYFQFFFQPSDGARIGAVKLDFLKEEKLRQSIKTLLDKFRYLQNVEGRTLKFNNASFIANNSLALEYINQGTGEENAIESVYNNIINHGKTVFDTLIKLKVTLPANIGQLEDSLVGKDDNRKDVGRDLFSLWYINNYINGYFLNELTSGNSEFYSKGTVDVVKRQSGVWGPQIRPRTGENATDPKFKVWVVDDTVIPLTHEDDSKPLEDRTKQSVRAFLTGLYSNRGISEEEIQEKVTKILQLFEETGFKMTDGAGFMTPKRRENLSKGFGSSYRMGNVNKPMHFQQLVKPEIAKEFETEEELKEFIANNSDYFTSKNGSKTTITPLENAEGKTIYPAYLLKVDPVYLKYASVELSDSLLGINRFNPEGKYPELVALRNLMDENGVGELIFKSAVKLGAPAKVRTVEQILTEAAPLGVTQSGYKIPDSEILELDNRHYGFQFNPTTQALKKVSHPTQLEYLSNLLETNKQQASIIFKALAFINEIKANKLKRKLSSQSIEAILRDLFDSPGAERVQHLLDEGATIDTPVIEAKAITQLASLFRKSVIDLKMRGGKLILQTQEGISNPEASFGDIISKKPSAEALQYTSVNGRSIAEAIVPRDLLTTEQRQIVDNGGEVLMLGFRIPSTEIHSSITLKVKGYYDKLGTNVVIIPKEIMAIHGADFDVDSLFTLVYEVAKSNVNLPNMILEKNQVLGKKHVRKAGKIVGYEDDYELINKELEEAIKLARANKDEATLDKLEKVQIQLASNKIIDQFIDISTSTANIDRMASPISKELFVKNGKVGETESGLLLLGKRGLISYDPTSRDPFEDKWDLSKAEDSADSHESVNEGAQLTGVFANNMKVLAILAKSSEGLHVGKRYLVDWMYKGVKTTLNSIRDLDLSSEHLTWQTLDTLINLAIDNVKDQALNKFRINSKNANIVSVLFGLGIPVADFALLSGTSIWRRISSDEFKNLDEGLKKLAEEFYGAGLYQDLKGTLKEGFQDRKVLSFEELDRFLELEATPESLEYKQIGVSILEALHKWNSLGKYTKTVSEVLGTLRDIPITVEDIESLNKKVRKLIKIDKKQVQQVIRKPGAPPVVVISKEEEETLDLAPLDNLELADTSNMLDFLDTVQNTLPVFKSTAAKTYFDTSYLIKNHPHVFTATRNIDNLYNLIKKLFKIHNPAIDNLASLKVGFKVDRNSTTHKVTMRREFAKFILINQFAEKLTQMQGFIKVTKNQEGEKIVTDKKFEGVRFWMETFLKEVRELQKLDRDLFLQFNGEGYKANSFLRNIVLEYNKDKKYWTLKTKSTSDFSGTFSERMEQGFKELRRFYRNEEGELRYDDDIVPSDMEDEYNDIQHAFLIYNVLTAGLNFGVTNYSAYIPPSFYKSLQNNYIATLLRTINQFSTSTVAKNKDLILAFYLKMAIANTNKVGTPQVKMGDEDNMDPKSVLTLKGSSAFNPENKKDFSILKGHKLNELGEPIFYDLLYEVPHDYRVINTGLSEFYDEESDEEVSDIDFTAKPKAEVEENDGMKEVKFPIFIQKNDHIYVRVYTFDNAVAYQRVGSDKSIDTSIIAKPESYDFDYYYSPKYRTLPEFTVDQKQVFKSNVNLDYELETGRPIRVSNITNIYRTIEKWYKVTAYNADTKSYVVEETEAPIQPKEVIEEEFVETPPILNFAAPSKLDEIKTEGTKWKDTTELVNNKQVIREYEHSDTHKRVMRLTDNLAGFLNKYLKRTPHTEHSSTFYESIGKKLWEGKDPEESQLFPKFSHEPMNMKEYIAHREALANKWTGVGRAGHKLLEAVITGINSGTQKFQEIVDEAKEILDESGADWNIVGWLLESGKDKVLYAHKVLEKAGINLEEDEIAPEVRTASELWGYGTTHDLLIKHKDGTYSEIDFKFGRSFNRTDYPFMMKYGQQLIDIWETPKSVAKAEVMLRAMMLKTENPEMKFKNLAVNWVPSKSTVDWHNDYGRFVEVESYLEMIKQALEAEYKKAPEADKANTIYGKLQQLPHFEDIFNPTHYRAGYSEQQNSLAVAEQANTEESLTRYLADLRKNIQWDLNPYITTGGHSERSHIKRNRLAKAVELTNKIIDLKRSGVTNAKWDEDISWMTLYTGSNRDVSNPYIEIYSRFLDEANDKANKRFFLIQSLYKEYLFPVMGHYYDQKGLKPPTSGQKAKAGLWTLIDPVQFWMPFYKINSDGIKTLNTTDEDWRKAAEKYEFLKDEKVRKDYKALADFMMDTMEQFFKNEKSHYGKAMANRDATWRVDPLTGVEKVVSDLGLHLNPRPELGQEKRVWNYTRGWFPKIPVTQDETGNILTRTFSSKYWKSLYNAHTVNYFESELLQERNIEEAIPWRYLGSPRIEAEEEYSLNLEASFLQFMNYHILKEERTDVFALGRGLMERAKYVQEQNMYTPMDNVIKYLDKMVKMQIQGVKQTDFSGGLLRKDIPLITNVRGNAKRPDWVKIIRSIKSSSAAPIMLLKPFQGAANAVFISLYTLKEAIKDTVIKNTGAGNFLKVDSNFTGFTVADLTKGWGNYSSFIKDNISNEQHRNKMWLLAKKLNYIPDTFDIYTDAMEGNINRGRIFDKSTLYMFHSAPEEAMAMTIMAAQLHHMKIKSNDENNGKSLWEMYELKELTDEKTGQKYWDVVWKDDYVRGFINENPEGVAPNYVPVKGLTLDEMRKMKYMYQRMHGGYRTDERTYLEYFVLGEIFMQFKRYLPTLLRNYAQSKGKIQSYGYYKPKMENGQVIMHDGKEVVEWHSRIVEGRFKTMLGLFLNAVSVRKPAGDNLTLKDKFLTMLGIQELESYTWDRIDEAQRELVVDALVTFTMYMAILGVYLAAGGQGGDDKDPFLKFTYRVKNNLVQSWSAMEAAREVLANGWPSTFKVSWYRIKALHDIGWNTMLLTAGYEEEALTKQGTIQGTNQFIKYWLPYGGSYYDFVRLILGEEYVDEYTFRK